MVVLVVVLWLALRANALRSQLQIGAQDRIQHQWSAQHPGVAPNLWTYAGRSAVHVRSRSRSAPIARLPHIGDPQHRHAVLSSLPMSEIGSLVPHDVVSVTPPGPFGPGYAP